MAERMSGELEHMSNGGNWKNVRKKSSRENCDQTYAVIHLAASTVFLQD
jgi:hypothetical protein